MPISHHHHRVMNHQEDATTTATTIQPNPLPKPNYKLIYFILRTIIMALVVSIFLFFLGIAALVLLHFFLSSSTSSFHLHRRRHRHRHRNHLRRSSASGRRSSSYTIEELQKFLSFFVYSSSEFYKAKDCAICLESFKNGERCRKLPACNHLFHVRCVDEWLISVPNCPICRSRVELYSTASSSVSTDDDSKLFWVVNA